VSVQVAVAPGDPVTGEIRTLHHAVKKPVNKAP
jgi:hypothetical protein